MSKLREAQDSYNRTAITAASPQRSFSHSNSVLVSCDVREEDATFDACLSQVNSRKTSLDNNKQSEQPPQQNGDVCGASESRHLGKSRPRSGGQRARVVNNDGLSKVLDGVPSEVPLNSINNNNYMPCSPSLKASPFKVTESNALIFTAATSQHSQQPAAASTSTPTASKTTAPRNINMPLTSISKRSQPQPQQAIQFTDDQMEKIRSSQQQQQRRHHRAGAIPPPPPRDLDIELVDRESMERVRHLVSPTHQVAATCDAQSRDDNNSSVRAMSQQQNQKKRSSDFNSRDEKLSRLKAIHESSQSADIIYI